MSNVALKEHLQLCIQRAKTYTNAQVLDMNELNRYAAVTGNRVLVLNTENVVVFDSTGSLTGSAVLVFEGTCAY